MLSLAACWLKPQVHLSIAISWSLMRRSFMLRNQSCCNGQDICCMWSRCISAHPTQVTPKTATLNCRTIDGHNLHEIVIHLKHYILKTIIYCKINGCNKYHFACCCACLPSNCKTAKLTSSFFSNHA